MVVGASRPYRPTGTKTGLVLPVLVPIPVPAHHGTPRSIFDLFLRLIRKYARRRARAERTLNSTFVGVRAPRFFHAHPHRSKRRHGGHRGRRHTAGRPPSAESRRQPYGSGRRNVLMSRKRLGELSWSVSRRPSMGVLPEHRRLCPGRQLLQSTTAVADTATAIATVVPAIALSSSTELCFSASMLGGSRGGWPSDWRRRSCFHRLLCDQRMLLLPSHACHLSQHGILWNVPYFI